MKLDRTAGNQILRLELFELLMNGDCQQGRSTGQAGVLSVKPSSYHF
jgi:hypothetical protein